LTKKRFLGKDEASPKLPDMPPAGPQLPVVRRDGAWDSASTSTQDEASKETEEQPNQESSEEYETRPLLRRTRSAIWYSAAANNRLKAIREGSTKRSASTHDVRRPKDEDEDLVYTLSVAGPMAISVGPTAAL
jgi:hypothetical protein